MTLEELIKAIDDDCDCHGWACRQRSRVRPNGGAVKTALVCDECVAKARHVDNLLQLSIGLIGKRRCSICGEWRHPKQGVPLAHLGSPEGINTYYAETRMRIWNAMPRRPHLHQTQHADHFAMFLAFFRPAVGDGQARAKAVFG